MIKNIIEYEVKYGENVDFDDIPKEDIDAKILWGCSPYGEYELALILLDKSYKIIKKKYDLDIGGMNLWKKKVYLILGTFNLESVKKYMSYTKSFLIRKFGDKPGNMAYNKFLNEHIIGDELWYEKYIKNNKEFKDFLEKELRSLFKYFEKREYRLGYTLDKLEGFIGNEDFDNMGESTRELYWLKFKEKGKVKIKGEI
ncbi:hypothetical protein CSA08_02005 [Candidatus Gracilibacteria bacterium]|nr:MAG: hypothetical protein CSA08_02005 [Candidatus Gracilibacteria bacterium]